MNDRYRTQLCNDGLGCRRRVCFFAHTLQELRVPSSKPFVDPETLAAVTTAAAANEAAKVEDALKLQRVRHCFPWLPPPSDQDDHGWAILGTCLLLPHYAREQRSDPAD